MKLLLLGGTRFLGRTLAELALQRGDAVTLFNRGNNAVPELAGAEQIRGDRNEGLAPLAGRRWDVVIDTCGYIPRHVGDSARFLANAVERYVFISSISVYDDMKTCGQDESASICRQEGDLGEQITAESYGPLKIQCEEIAEREMPGRVLQVRAGLIVGPHDPTGRFTYWVRRLGRGGDVLAPSPAGALIQFIDVRDLSAWILAAADARLVGTFNAHGPVGGECTMGGLIDICRDVAGTPSTVHWVDESFLLENGVQPWSELPLWIPDAQPSFGTFSNAKAARHGLTTRPIADTVRDTLAWDRAAGHPPMKASLAPEREEEVLRSWRARAT